MRTHVRNRIKKLGLVGLGFCAWSSFAAAQEFKAGGITVIAPWARATPGSAKVGGAYLELKAAGAGDRLISATSTVAGTVEIHEHVNEGGVMKMRRVDGLAVPAGGSVTLKPGGYHLMLMDLKRPLKQGDKLQLTLTFEKAGTVAVEGPIAPIGAMAADDDAGQGAKRPGKTPSSQGSGHKH
jgi:copper(I)-binding protein